MSIPSSLRNKAVELKLRSMRALEEENISKLEMVHVYNYYCTMHASVQTALNDKSNVLSAGQHAVLLQKLVTIELKCCELFTAFQPYVDLEPMVKCRTVAAASVNPQDCNLTLPADDIIWDLGLICDSDDDDNC